MKLPNGFGSIVKLSGNRRKPYAVRRHGKYLAYFATHDEALIYLADVNKQPDIIGSELTFAEIYRLEMVAPRRGAWIEIQSSAPMYPQAYWSHPAGVRG